MLQDASMAEQNFQQFVEGVTQTQIVWALKSEEGYATSQSNEYEEVEVIPFWSEEAAAALLSRDEWAGFAPAQMPLADFLEFWLVGMNSEGILAGTNWNLELSGMEVDPLDLALELSDALLEKGISLKLTRYRDVEDYNQQVRKALEE